MLSLIFISLIGVTIILGSIAIPFDREHSTLVQRSIAVFAACLIAAGAAGFFGLGFSSAGGMAWAPETFEWPAGRVGGVVRTSDGFYVVPHTPSSRIQIYDRDWSFVRGWYVDASGGTFKAYVTDGTQINVVTARGNKHLLFDTNGEITSEGTYVEGSYDSFPDDGDTYVVPTAIWLWPFSHPFIAWSIFFSGMIILIVMDQFRRKRRIAAAVAESRERRLERQC